MGSFELTPKIKKMSLLVKLTFFVIYILCNTKLLISATECIPDPDKEYQCIFKSVVTNETNPHFYPTSNNSHTFTMIKCIGCHLYSLTKELCVEFPNLETLEIRNAEIQIITSDALQNCSNIKTIDLNDNKIMEFNGRLLWNSKKLEKLQLSQNKIQNINIFEFPILNKLHTLSLKYNSLTDVDDQAIIYKFQKLQQIEINDNLLDCDRLRIMIATLRRSGILYDQNIKVNGINVDGVHCVEEKQRIINEVDSEISEIEDEVSNITNKMIDLDDVQIKLNKTLKELSENLKKSIPDLVDVLANVEESINITDSYIQSVDCQIENISNELEELKAAANRQKDELDSLYTIQECVADNFDDNNNNLENLKSMLNSKTEESEKIYYGSLSVFIIITFIAVVVVTVLINMFFHT